LGPFRRLARWLALPSQQRFLKFCVVGASGVPVNLLLTYLGHAVLFAGLAPAWRDGLALLLGIGVSIFTNFLLNDIWTWRDRGKRRTFFGRLARFYLVCSGAAALQWGVAYALSRWLALYLLLAQLVGIALATVVNFVANNLWTFHRDGPDDRP